MVLRFSKRAAALGLGALLVASGVGVACSDEPTVVTPLDAAVPPRESGSAPALDGAALDGSADATGERDPCAPSGAPLCAPGAVWDAPVAVVQGRFVSITPDELHLVVAQADDAGTTLRVFDRAAVTDTFSASQVFGFPVDGSGASLSKDAKLLVVTRNGRPQLSTRTGAGVAFGVPDGTVFPFGDEGQRFRAPVMLENDAMFLTAFGASVGQLGFTLVDKVGAIYRPETQVYPQPELENTSPDGAAVKSPTGMSTDLRTLFFYDEEKKVTKAAFRPAPGCPYTTFADLGDRPFAMPNAACTAIYYADPTLGVARMARKP